MCRAAILLLGYTLGQLNIQRCQWGSVKTTAEQSSCSVGLYFTAKLQSAVDGKLKASCPNIPGSSGPEKEQGFSVNVSTAYIHKLLTKRKVAPKTIAEILDWTIIDLLTAVFPKLIGTHFTPLKKLSLDSAVTEKDLPQQEPFRRWFVWGLSQYYWSVWGGPQADWLGPFCCQDLAEGCTRMNKLSVTKPKWWGYFHVSLSAEFLH